MLLCYVDHHDRAYAWAERRKLETHPTTGAAQIIELREAVREIVVPTYVHAEPTPKPAPRPLAAASDEQLLGFGVPSDWLNDVRRADEDRLLALAGLSPRVLDERVDVRAGEANVATMHLAKGLEFRAVAVLACDDDVLPLQSRIEDVGDEGDLQETYDTERQLLYVACTRARDRLFVSGVEPGSEFLADLGGS